MTAEARVENIGAAHSPLAKLVVDSIRNRILTGKYAPGERLVEAHLSAELGVSRMPVREALRLLAADGFVTIEPRRGASVPVYTPEQIREFVEVRATLEGLNAKLAATRHEPETIKKLEQILAAGSKIAEKADWAQLHEANNNFHEALADVAANSTLRDMVRSLRERTAVIFAPHSHKRAKQNWEEHAAIVRAVVAGDGELASLLAARHVYNASEAIAQQQATADNPASANDIPSKTGT
ncbi:MAG TPA: GntR family transcriptional regulator [Ramlibacter sp.]|nr:GntR family transcriptional regulator [Ramlibacter sp.]